MSEKIKKAAPSAITITIAAIICNIVWGTPFKLLKIMNEELSVTKAALGDRFLAQAITVVSIRFFLAGILTLLFAVIFKKEDIFAVSKKQWGEIAIMGIVSTTIAYYFFNIANVTIVSTINSTIVAQSTIFFGVILAHFFYKDDKLDARKMTALIIGFAGLIISQLSKGTSISEMFNGVSFKGEGYMAIYGLVAAVATMLSRRISSNLDSFVMTGWNLVIGSVLLFLIGLMMGGDLSLVTWTSKGIILLVVLALASAIPFSLWYWCAQYAPLSELSMYKFIMPLSGSLLAVLLGEKFTAPLAIGLVLVCLSIIMISRPQKQKI
ncbi:MAG TPA: DMT family transporter [Erysipelothrix sp.]